MSTRRRARAALVAADEPAHRSKRQRRHKASPGRTASPLFEDDALRAHVAKLRAFGLLSAAERRVPPRTWIALCGRFNALDADEFAEALESADGVPSDYIPVLDVFTRAPLRKSTGIVRLSDGHAYSLVGMRRWLATFFSKSVRPVTPERYTLTDVDLRLVGVPPDDARWRPPLSVRQTHEQRQWELDAAEQRRANVGTPLIRMFPTPADILFLSQNISLDTSLQARHRLGVGAFYRLRAGQCLERVAFRRNGRELAESADQAPVNELARAVRQAIDADDHSVLPDMRNVVWRIVSYTPETNEYEISPFQGSIRLASGATCRCEMEASSFFYAYIWAGNDADQTQDDYDDDDDDSSSDSSDGDDELLRVPVHVLRSGIAQRVRARRSGTDASSFDPLGACPVVPLSDVTKTVFVHLQAEGTNVAEFLEALLDVNVILHRRRHRLVLGANPDAGRARGSVIDYSRADDVIPLGRHGNVFFVVEE